MNDDTTGSQWLDSVKAAGVSIDGATDSLRDLARKMHEYDLDFSFKTVRPEHVCGTDGWRHWDDDLAQFYGLGT